MRAWTAGVSWVSFVLCLILGSAGAAAQLAAVAVDAGENGVLRHHGNGGEVGAEARFAAYRLGFLPRFIPDFIPVLGAARTSKGALYGYAGFRLDFPLGTSPWVTTIGFAAGDYHQGGGKRLGGPVEFRSGIELARRLGDSSRLGLSLYHLSNAGLYEHNPGVESLILVYTYTLPGARRP